MPDVVSLWQPINPQTLIVVIPFDLLRLPRAQVEQRSLASGLAMVLADAAFDAWYAP